jgi:hypothetical protein
MSPHANTDFFNGIGAYVPECNASLMSAFGPRPLRDQWPRWRRKADVSEGALEGLPREISRRPSASPMRSVSPSGISGKIRADNALKRRQPLIFWSEPTFGCH